MSIRFITTIIIVIVVITGVSAFTDNNGLQDRSSSLNHSKA